jgi:hypothetical protein
MSLTAMLSRNKNLKCFKCGRAAVFRVARQKNHFVSCKQALSERVAWVIPENELGYWRKVGETISLS